MKTKLFITALFITVSFLTTKAQYTKLLDFAGVANGSHPQGSLISDGNFLYGVTLHGGVSNLGVLFKIKPDGTGYVKLLDFTGSANGGHPQGSLISDETFLYGMAYDGGSNVLGTIFKIKPDGTGFARLLDFAGASNGSQPQGSLISDGTFMYGMTSTGGSSDKGVIFKIKPDGTGFAKLLDFTGVANGSQPFGSLISDGVFLYGMTSGGGTTGDGIIFKIKPDGTGFAKLLDFAGTNGSYPWGDLISDGTFLYGMTEQGGINGNGGLFKIKPDGTEYGSLLGFTGGINGGTPDGSLIFDGTFLYGMTQLGGTNNNGTAFKINPAGTAYSLLLDFTGTASGSHPFGSLTFDGTFFYGMTWEGGTNDMGVIFKYQDTTATGIAEHPAKGGFNVYPNPTSGKFTIEMEGREGAKGKVLINDVFGQAVHEQTLNSNSSRVLGINLNLPDGVYFIHIITEQGTASRKIIVSQ